MPLLILSGPSCSGKSTIVNELKTKHNFIELKSHTTRSRRKPDEDDYIYVSRSEFDDLDLVERVDYAGNLYGLSISELNRAISPGIDFVVIVESHGAEQIWGKYHHKIPMVKVFLDADDICLERRLLERNVDIESRRSRWPQDRIDKGKYQAIVQNNDGVLAQATAEVLDAYRTWFSDALALTAACDGGCQNEKGCWAYTIPSQDKKSLVLVSDVIADPTTNNIAEYTALIKLLKNIRAYPHTWARKVTILMDSNLVYSQVNGLFKVKREHLKPLKEKACKLIQECQCQVELKWVSRETDEIRIVDKETKRLLGG